MNIRKHHQSWKNVATLVLRELLFEGVNFKTDPIMHREVNGRASPRPYYVQEEALDPEEVENIEYVEPYSLTQLIVGNIIGPFVMVTSAAFGVSCGISLLHVPSMDVLFQIGYALFDFMASKVRRLTGGS
jgi:hypothetical protein